MHTRMPVKFHIILARKQKYPIHLTFKQFRADYGVTGKEADKHSNQ